MQHYCLLIKFITPAAMLLLLSCIIPSDDVNEFSFSCAEPSDTIAPYGTITIAFSAAAADSPDVLFDFSPPFYTHTTTANSTRDTFTITLSEPLDGSARYVIRIRNTVRSISGAAITPQSDSVILFTCPVEQEPNDDSETADRLTGRMFGSVSETDDADMFLIDDSSSTAVYLISHGSNAVCILRNADHDSIDYHDFREKDTLHIPAAFTGPFHVTVYAWQKSVGGYYELGVLQK